MSLKQRLDVIERGLGKIYDSVYPNYLYRPEFILYRTPKPDHPDITMPPPYYYSRETGEVIPAKEFEAAEQEHYKNHPRGPIHPFRIAVDDSPISAEDD